MSIGIIVRPSGYSKSKHSAPAFKPHFNRSLGDNQNPNGKYFHTKEQYYTELKTRGLEPYDPSAADSGKRKAYTPSEALKKTVNEIHNQTHKGKFKPSDRLIKQMESMGVNTKVSREDIKHLPKHYQSGGFYAANER